MFLLHEAKIDTREIIIKSGIQASIIELFHHKIAHEIKTHFIVEEGASLEYVKLQDGLNNSDFYYQFELHENATINMHNFELSKSDSKHYFQAILDAPNSELYINGLVQLFENTQCENHFDITHKQLHTLSQLEYRHSLHDYTKALFQAKTKVENSASYAQAYQNSNTLLLSDDAVIFAQPHLEIEVDELQASHGATTGSLNQDELLYLQSRGIDEQKANHILLKAFENVIYDKINDEKIKEYINKYKRKNDE